VARRILVLGACALAIAAPAASASVAAVPRAGGSVVVLAARSGHVAAALAALRRAGGHASVRRGRLIQARLPAAAVRRLRRSPAVAGVGPAQPGHADGMIVSQGVYRTGADALQRAGLTGKGVRIAVLDLGFGQFWQGLVGTELPPFSQLLGAVSFDHTTGLGLAGESAADESTRHGEQVAQVVHDMAPGASLLLVNYHTELEFAQAVDWLVHGPDGRPRVDVIVHSNSFLDGPFDGTSLPAQAVDRAHAAGILWVNSAGNYATRHWEGVAGDADGDGWADIGPPGQEGLVFDKTASTTLGADLTWSRCTRAGQPVDARSVGYELDVTDAGFDVLVHGSLDATRPLESVGLGADRAGTFVLRVRSPDPTVSCNLEIFSSGVDFGTQAAPDSSIPTPGDARGSLTVGATWWQDDSLAAFSSRGPTEDGRLEPQLVAPTGTLVAPGWAMVGTSSSAPHVAGAAALLIQRARQAGQPTDPDAITQQLEASALDLGPPGPDDEYGYGRLRLELTPPSVLAATPAAGALVHGTVGLRALAVDAGTLSTTDVAVDGEPVGSGAALGVLPWSSTLVPDGPHTVVFTVHDMAGNVAQLSVPFTVDNTPPVLAQAPSPTPGALVVAVQDAGSPSAVATYEVRDAAGGVAGQGRVALPLVAGQATLTVPRPDDGPAPYTVRVQAVDAAGNPSLPLSLPLP
jgi:hypothetical protein